VIFSRKSGFVEREQKENAIFVKKHQTHLPFFLLPVSDEIP